MLKKVEKRTLSISVYTFITNGKGNQHIYIQSETQKQIGQTYQTPKQTQVKQTI